MSALDNSLNSTLSLEMLSENHSAQRRDLVLGLQRRLLHLLVKKGIKTGKTCVSENEKIATEKIGLTNVKIGLRTEKMGLTPEKIVLQLKI